jgi:hypothetical protein
MKNTSIHKETRVSKIKLYINVFLILNLIIFINKFKYNF